MNEKVYSSVPVNKLAARVVSKPEFEDDIEYNTIGRIHSEHPLPTEHIKVSNPNHRLTSKRFGNFVVQGAFLLINPKANRRWVVKCDCGRYEVRTRKQLLYKSETKCCIKCYSLRIKLEAYEVRLIDEIQGKEQRVMYILGEDMGGGRFRKPGKRYTKQLKVGDLMYNPKGSRSKIVYVSSEQITFERRLFKSGEVVYLDVSEEEAYKRQQGDFRK